MIKVEIVTAATVEMLQNRINELTSNGWHLHGGVEITYWQKGHSQEGWTMACGFLQVLTRPEGTCKNSRASTEPT